MLAFNWTMGTFDLPQQLQAPPHVPPQTQVQPASQSEPHLKPQAELELRPQPHASLEPEAAPGTCDRADARLPPFSTEVILVCLWLTQRPLREPLLLIAVPAAGPPSAVLQVHAAELHEP